MRKIISAIFLFSLLSLSLIKLAGAVELPSIDKSKIRLSVVPGEKAQYGEMTVENQSSEPRSMRVYLSDWEYLPAADGTKDFYPVNTTPLSCSSWISFSPAEFTLPPFSKQKVNYSVKAPPEAKGGYYAALFFESIFSRAGVDQEEAHVGMNLAIRIATLFYVEASGTIKRTASIENLSFKKDPLTGSYSTRLDFHNTGNTDIVCAGTFHIMNSQGLVIARGMLNDAYTFPGSSAKLTAAFNDILPAGKYDLIFTLDLGKALEEANVGRGPVITKEAEISIGEKGKILNIGQLK